MAESLDINLNRWQFNYIFNVQLTIYFFQHLVYNLLSKLTKMVVIDRFCIIFDQI